MYLVSPQVLDGQTVLRDKDVIQMATSPGVPGYVKLRLHSQLNVRWWKEIKVFTTRWGTAQDYTQDDRHDTTTLIFQTDQVGGADLVFSKAKAFGVHTGVYELHNLQSFDGKQVDFTWMRDG